MPLTRVSGIFYAFLRNACATKIRKSASEGSGLNPKSGPLRWRRKAAEMPELQITVSDLLEHVATPEDRKNHIDIADLLIREMLNPVPREPSLEEILAGLPDEVYFQRAVQKM